VQGGGRCWLHLFALLSLYTGTIQQLNLIHYCPQQDTKAHNSAINCLQTLENCNNSWDWDEDHIIRFARKWEFQAPVRLVDCVVVLFLSEREPCEEAEDEPRGHPRRTRSRRSSGWDLLPKLWRQSSTLAISNYPVCPYHLRP
jgi:hypothetical protein